jgi:hypothetical protein
MVFKTVLANGQRKLAGKNWQTASVSWLVPQANGQRKLAGVYQKSFANSKALG